MRALPLSSLLVCAALVLAGCALGPEETAEESTGETETGPLSLPPEPGETPTGISPGGSTGPPAAAPATTPDATPTAAAPSPPVPATPAATTPPPAGATPPPAQATPTPPPSTPATPTQPTQPTQPTLAEPTAWPREGSHVSYYAEQYHGSRFGRSTITHVNATWTYANGDWTGTCTAHVRPYDPETDTHNATGTIETRTYSAASPPHWPPMNTRSPPPVGGEMQAWVFDECDLETTHTAVYAGTDAETVNGATVPTHRATHHPAYDNQQLDTEWSQKTGLLIHYRYSWWGSTQSNSLKGHIVSTDAPLT